MLKISISSSWKKITRTHDLIVLSKEVKELIEISEEMLDNFDIATAYYIDQRYPVIKGHLPSKNEIKKVYDTATYLFQQVQRIID